MSVVLIKRFLYRGANEEWGNRYHLTGADPADAAAWHTLINAIRDGEKAASTSRVSFVRAYGYNSGAAVSTYTLDYSAPGEGIQTGGAFAPTLSSTCGRCPGDCALLVRWTTAKRNTLGRTVWARKYYHDVYTDNNDAIFAAQRTLWLTFGGLMTGGTLPGGRVLCLPDGTVAGACTIPTYVTTHTLKRRGKRPV
jgi:hypothetical protein